jgi:hypothetical protein
MVGTSGDEVWLKSLEKILHESNTRRARLEGVRCARVIGHADTPFLNFKVSRVHELLKLFFPVLSSNLTK